MMAWLIRKILGEAPDYDDKEQRILETRRKAMTTRKSALELRVAVARQREERR